MLVVGFIDDEILRVGLKNDSHWSMKYRSRPVGQCGCRVGTSRRSHMQGLMVVSFIIN